MDYTKFMKDGIGKLLKNLPPEQQADGNRLIQELKTIMPNTETLKDPEGDIIKAHNKFKEGLKKHSQAQKDMSAKYDDDNKS